jgi:hypothetical protein
VNLACHLSTDHDRVAHLSATYVAPVARCQNLPYNSPHLASYVAHVASYQTHHDDNLHDRNRHWTTIAIVDHSQGNLPQYAPRPHIPNNYAREIFACHIGAVMAISIAHYIARYN